MPKTAIKKGVAVGIVLLSVQNAHFVRLFKEVEGCEFAVYQTGGPWAYFDTITDAVRRWADIADGLDP